MCEINNFILGLDISHDKWPELKGALPINKKMIFNNVSSLHIKEGTYSPNNDYLYLAENIPEDQCPNFILLVSRAMVAVSCSGNGVFVHNAVPVNKLFVSMLPPDCPFKISNIYLEGRPGASVAPMAQGVPVDYFFLCAKAIF